MATLPSSLALATIATDADIVSADHRNNYAALQAEANALLTILGSGASGQVLTGVGTTLSWVYPPGYDFGSEIEFTTQVSVTATTEATATTIVTANSVTFDGSTSVYVEFWCPYFQAASTASMTLCIYDKIGAASAASIGLGTVVYDQVASSNAEGMFFRTNKLTPTAAAHIFSARAYVSTGTGFATAGLGGVGAFFPGGIRVIKA